MRGRAWERRRTREDAEVQGLHAPARLQRRLHEPGPRCSRHPRRQRLRGKRATGRALRTSTKWLGASTCVPVCAQNPSSIDSLQMSPRACASAPGLGRELACSLSGDTCTGARACLGLAERAEAAQAGVTAHHHAARVQGHRYVDDALPALLRAPWVWRLT